MNEAQRRMARILRAPSLGHAVREAVEFVAGGDSAMDAATLLANPQQSWPEGAVRSSRTASTTVSRRRLTAHRGSRIPDRKTTRSGRRGRPGRKLTSVKSDVGRVCMFNAD